MSTRVERALARLRKKFAAGETPHRPSPAHWRAIEWQLREVHEQPERRAAGSRDYSLSTLDCGIGKTQAIVAYAQELMAAHAAGVETGGMAIFSDRLADIYAPPDGDAPESGLVVDLFEDREERRAAKALGLFGVYTHDKDRNRLGADPAICFESPEVPILGHVPVLLTTQAMLLQRSEDYGYRFADIVPFWFRGQPRAHLVWDEHLLCSMPLALDPEMAGRLIPEMRKLSPDLADAFNDDMQALRKAAAGKLFYLRDYSAEFGIDQEDLYRCGGDSEQDQAMATTVAKLQGKAGVVRRDKDWRKATTLLTYSENLCPDMPPLLICDANGRFSYEYQAWAKRRGNLTICPIEATKVYPAMKIRMWDTGSGRVAWGSKGRRQPLLDGLVTYLNRLPHDEEVLVLHFKERNGQLRKGRGHVPSIPNLIKRHCHTETGEKVINPKRLLFTHWPAKGTNRFRNVKHVVVSGAYFLPDAQYEAIARACMGLLPEEHLEKPAELAQIIKAIDQGHLFQGILRIIARKAVGEGCPPCDALIIGSSKSGITREAVAEIFPKAPIIGWSPKRGDGAIREHAGKPTNAALLVKFLEAAAAGGRESLTWTEIREAVGIGGPEKTTSQMFRNHKALAGARELWSPYRVSQKGLAKEDFAGAVGGLRRVA